MGNLNPKPIDIEFDSKIYGVQFNINMIDEVQTHFEKPIGEIYDLIMDSPKSASNLRYLLTILLNDAIETHESETGERVQRLSETEVGRKIDIRDFNYYYTKVIEAFGVSLPEADEDEDPNSKGGRQS